MLELTCFGPLALLAVVVAIDYAVKRRARRLARFRVTFRPAGGRVLTLVEQIDHGGI